MERSCWGSQSGGRICFGVYGGHSPKVWHPLGVQRPTAGALRSFVVVFFLRGELVTAKMPENDEGNASTFELPSASGTGDLDDVDAAKNRSCRGCLLYSSSLRYTQRNPICIGLGRPEPRVFNTMGESERDAAKDGRGLEDFKYACIGYSIYKENTVTPGRPIEGAELPLCVGVEFLADRRPQPAGSNPGVLEQSQRDEGPVMPRPPSSVHQPVTVGGMSTGEFASRFFRCGGLVASAVVRNMSHIITSVKRGFDDMVHERRRPK